MSIFDKWIARFVQTRCCDVSSVQLIGLLYRTSETPLATLLGCPDKFRRRSRGLRRFLRPQCFLSTSIALHKNYPGLLHITESYGMNETMSNAVPERPARLACIECRRKHVKCDGVTPVCGRCAAEKQKCNYTPSRRGRVRRRRGCSTADDVIPQDNALVSLPSNPLAEDMTTIHSPTETGSIESRATSSNSRGPSVLAGLDHVEYQRLLNLFYTRFYPAHPFLVPRSAYSAQHFPAYLELVVCFIGNHFHSASSYTLFLKDAIMAAMSDSTDEPSAARVQALMLFSIIMHARHQTRDAEAAISRAVKIAITIGLNRENYGVDQGASNQQLESLRRTWWELYTIDAYTAALHRRTTFASRNVSPQPFLPKSQFVFESDSFTPPISIQAFDARVFSSDSTMNLNFSPYCYRIEAIRIIERVLTLAASDNAQADEIQSVDNAIASWKYHLPNYGADVVDASGDVDPLLFQAHFMIHCASIFLHFPRSDLPATVPSAADITCVKGYTQLAPTSSHHTIKAIAASKELSNLAAIPVDPTQHSPYFSCGLILGCIVQLAVASIHLHTCGSQCLQQHRDRVMLMLGVLNRLGRTWAVAQNAVGHIRTVANAVFSPHQSTASDQSICESSLPDSGVDFGDLPSNASWFDLFSPNEFREELLAFAPDNV